MSSSSDKQEKKGNEDNQKEGSVTVHYVPVDEIVDDIRGIIENIAEQKANPEIATSIEVFRTMLDKIVIMIKLFGALGGIYFYLTGLLVNKVGGIGTIIALIFSMLFCVISFAWSGAKVLNSIQPQEQLKALVGMGLTALEFGEFDGIPPMEQIKTVLYSHLNNCGKTKYFIELTAQCIFSLIGFITSFIQIFSAGPHFGLFGIPLTVILPLSILGIILTTFHAGGLIVWVIITLGLIFGKVVGKLLNALRCNFNDTCNNEIEDVNVYGIENQKAMAEIKEKQESADVQAVSKKDMLSTKKITKKEKKIIIKCYKNKGEEEKLGKLMEEIVVDPKKYKKNGEDGETNGEIDNEGYGNALKEARKKINSIIAECNSGMYKDINKLIGLNYKKLKELKQKTANAEDRYTRKINNRVNFAMTQLQEKARDEDGEININKRNKLVVDKEIVKAWKKRSERGVVGYSRQGASAISNLYNTAKERVSNINKTRDAYNAENYDQKKIDKLVDKIGKNGIKFLKNEQSMKKLIKLKNNAEERNKKKALNRIKFAMWYLMNNSSNLSLKKAWANREGREKENDNGLQLDSKYDFTNEQVKIYQGLKTAEKIKSKKNE